MRRIFSRRGDPILIHGFDSIAPSGDQIESKLKKHLNSISDYSKYLDQIESSEAAQFAVSQLKRNFNGTNVLSCFGEMPPPNEYGDSRPRACDLMDEQRSIPERLRAVRDILTDPKERLNSLPLILDFFEQVPIESPIERNDDETKKALGSLSGNEAALSGLLQMAQTLTKNSPFMGLRVLGWIKSLEGQKVLSEKDFYETVKTVVLAQFQKNKSLPLEAEDVDLICTMMSVRSVAELKLDISAKDFQHVNFENENGRQAIACVRSINAEVVKKLQQPLKGRK
jgi:hypothetical protein